jgi:predicted RNase H-like nuclease (RuvC/YqgF family)
MIRRHIPEAQHHRAEQLEREVRELRAVVGHLQREIAELHEQLRRKRD